MVIRLFILNKDNHCVAVKSDGSYECLSGGDLYMEPIDEAVKRIADEYLGVQLDSDRLNLVRRKVLQLWRNMAVELMRLLLTCMSVVAMRYVLMIQTSRGFL